MLTWEVEFFDGQIERVGAESGTEAMRKAEQQYKKRVEDLGVYYEDQPITSCREVCVERQ